MPEAITSLRARTLELALGTLLLVAGLAVYFAYARAFGAGWTFDDMQPLLGLGEVHDLASAIGFLTHDRNISFFGRPVAMASFFLNIGDWPGHPSSFRHINTLIHVLNGLLVALVALRIARLIPRLAPRAAGFAVTLAAIWMLHPFLASTSFHVIQRMTLLAATFSLLGLLAYLHGRALLATRPASGYAWMSGGLLLGTAIGVFAKENAALTPLLVAALEFTLLSAYAPVTHRLLPRWQVLFFGLPALALTAYVAYFLVHASEHYVIRSFTLSERLLSESVILFEYVRQILVPDILSMGPYQDDSARILGLGPLTLLASLAWALLVGLALAARRRMPVFSFAILFFLAGHLIESSVISLELYFEHRNYLPSLGLLGAVTGAAWACRPNWPKLATVAFAGLMVALLLRTMTLWGNPYQSAGVWAREHPTSSRAVQNLATFYQRFGRFDVAAKIIIDNYRLKPRDGGLALQTAITQCFIGDRDLRDSLIAQVTREAPRLDFSPVAALTLHKMIDLHLQGKCNSFRPDDVIGIGRGLLHNPGYAHPDQRYAVLFAVARALELGGDKEQAMATKRQAFRLAPNIQAAKTIFFELQAAGRGQEAAGFLSEARASAPRFSNDYDTWERAAQVGSAAPAAIKKSLDRPSVGEGERRDDSFVTVGNGEARRSFQ